MCLVPAELVCPFLTSSSRINPTQETCNDCELVYPLSEFRNEWHSRKGIQTSENAIHQPFSILFPVPDEGGISIALGLPGKRPRFSGIGIGAFPFNLVSRIVFRNNSFADEIFRFF